MPRRLKVAVIGAGRVGTTLAVLLYRRGHTIVSVVSRSRSSARRCARLVRCTNYSSRFSALSPEADVVLVATPENVLPTVARSLAADRSFDWKNLFVYHTAGAVSSDVFAPLARRGAHVGSLHPIQTFSPNVPLTSQLRAMHGVTYGIEGDRTTLRVARQIVRLLGGRAIEVPKEEKILYHLACVFASNFPVLLLSGVVELSRRFHARYSLAPFTKLLMTSIENAVRVGPTQALTGPFTRGSAGTVRTHRTALQQRHPDLVAVYRALGRYAVRVLEAEKRITPRQAAQLRSALS